MLRKFRININGKEYMVEMEELTPGASQLQNQVVETTHPVPQAAPVAPPTPAAPTTPVQPVSGEGEEITSPMPGNILDIKVKVGDVVEENQVVAVLEAMKMENEIVAPRAGTITAVSATKGAPIDVGEPIVFIN